MCAVSNAQPSGSNVRAFIDALRPTSDKWAEPTGPHKVMMEVNADFPDYTVYRPEDLSKVKDKSLPVVIMMGPGCNQDGDSFRPFWSEVASYGYYVIAVGRPLPSGYQPPIFFLGAEDVKKGLDWIFDMVAINADPVFKKVDTKHVCLMGQSCGGVQCLRLAAEDSRVSNIVFWNSGSVLMGNVDTTRPHVYGEGRDIYGTKDLKGLVLSLKIPVAYFVGDTDMARSPALSDFNDIASTGVVYAVREIPGDSHAGTFREKNGGAFGKAAVDWLQWQFRKDKTSKASFVGKTPTLSLDSKWIELKTKNIK